MSRLRSYLDDPLLRTMYDAIRGAGALKSISLDLTRKCNLRCKGCYFFAEGMDRVEAADDDAAFDELLRSELQRGTNFVTVVGGEPALRPDRLRKIYRHFRMNVATNGLIRIPREGLEDMPLGIAIWGDAGTDSRLRGDGRQDLFARARANYRDDPRAFWYYTVAPGHAHEIERVVEQCVGNGNRVLFNYYSDIEGLGGDLDYRCGFETVRREVDRMIDRYGDMIFTTRYFNAVVTSGRLGGQRWGYDVCTNLSANHPGNQERLGNGNPFNPHFRAYNADFRSTRRCCTGISRSCDSCFDTWEHFSWVMINMRGHLASRRAFTNWLTTTFVFYLVNRLVDQATGLECLARIQSATEASVAESWSQTA